MNNNSIRKKVLKIFCISLLIFILLVLLTLAAISAVEYRKKYASAETQIYLTSFIADERRERENNILKKDEEEKELRSQLMSALIENDRKDLLTLVNPWNAISDDYSPRLVSIGDDLLFDERGVADLSQMIKDCKESYDRAPVPISTYRTYEYQEELYSNKIERLLQSGEVTMETVYDIAAQSVARPGTSEHHLGLAIDIIDEFYTELDDYQMYTNTQQWLIEHCYEYGFILRYPEDTTDITGIIYEPWHYRYVGKTIAKEIKESGLVFEEYLKTVS